MGNDGVAAVHHAGVVAALVEHTQVAAQHAGEVHITVHSALVRADHGELLLVEGQGGVLLQQALEHLIGGHGVIEAHQGHCVLHAGVVCVKGDDVAHAHGLQLLQGHSAVQALAHHAAVLTAAVQAGHDDGNAVCLTGHSLDQTLQVCKVIVRGHVVLVVEQLVGDAVIARVHHDKDIVAADRLLDQTLGVAALEAGAVAGNNEGVFFNSGSLCPTDKVLVDQAGQLLCTGAGDQPHIRHTGLLKEGLRGNFNRHSHITPYCCLPSVPCTQVRISGFILSHFVDCSISICFMYRFSAPCTAVFPFPSRECEFLTKKRPNLYRFAKFI